MREKWTGVLIGKMHNNNVSQNDLAQKLGVGKSYISMILNGERTPKNAKEKLKKALDEIIKERNVKND